MKNFNLVLFLLLNVIISISLFDKYNAQYKRFIHTENVTFEYRYLYNYYNNPNYIETDLKSTCIPLYNSNQIDGKKLEKDIMAFRFETSIQMYMWDKPSLYDIVVLNGDIPEKSQGYGIPVVEVCQTYEFREPQPHYSDFRISCRTREFKKDYSIALCARSSPINGYRIFMYSMKQRKMIKVSGYSK